MTADRVRRAREALHASPIHVAAFIGLPSVQSYLDLEMHDDEPWTLTLIELARACAILALQPAEIWPSAGVAGGTCTFEASVDEYGRPRIAVRLAHLLAAQTCGVEWDESALVDWLRDDLTLAEIPLDALNDICNAVGIALPEVVDAYLAAMGH